MLLWVRTWHDSVVCMASLCACAMHTGGGTVHTGGGAVHVGGGAVHTGGGAVHSGGGAVHTGVSGLRTNSHLTNPGVCWLEDGFV